MPRKQTTPRVSTIASTLAGLTGDQLQSEILNALAENRLQDYCNGFMADVRRVSASALSQDERKGND